MSPRPSRRRRERPQAGRTQGGGAYDRTEEWQDGEWTVRPVTGSAATKAYRCPGCDHEIRPNTPHLVTWPSGGFGGLEDRRHWHLPCWRNRMHRAPARRHPPRR